MQYPTSYRTAQIKGLSIFYREAGPQDAPTLLLLHGLPSSSRMFEPLLARLRSLPGLVEKSRGVFYRKSKAFLHFHEDPRGLFADIRNAAGSDFDSLYAHVKYGQTGQINLPQIVVQIQDGKLVPIFTDKMLNKPLYPIPAWDKR